MTESKSVALAAWLHPNILVQFYKSPTKHIKYLLYALQRRKSFFVLDKRDSLTITSSTIPFFKELSIDSNISFGEKGGIRTHNSALLRSVRLPIALTFPFNDNFPPQRGSYPPDCNLISFFPLGSNHYHDIFTTSFFSLLTKSEE